MDKATCSAPEGCDRPVKGRGMCGKHWQRWRKQQGTARLRFAPPETCTINDCGKPHDTRGWCGGHYARFLRYGDPLGRPGSKPNDAISYTSFHRRLRKARGSASSYACVDCGKAAAHWAYLHGEDPRNFDSYVPMCRSCHAKYDTYPETREKWRRSIEVYWTPERRVLASVNSPRRRREQG